MYYLYSTTFMLNLQRMIVCVRFSLKLSIIAKCRHKQNQMEFKRNCSLISFTEDSKSPAKVHLNTEEKTLQLLSKAHRRTMNVTLRKIYNLLVMKLFHCVKRSGFTQVLSK